MQGYRAMPFCSLLMKGLGITCFIGHPQPQHYVGCKYVVATLLGSHLACEFNQIKLIPTCITFQRNTLPQIAAYVLKLYVYA